MLQRIPWILRPRSGSRTKKKGEQAEKRTEIRNGVETIRAQFAARLKLPRLAECTPFCYLRSFLGWALFSGTQECHPTNTVLRLGRSAAAAVLCSGDYPVCQGPGTT